ncbi:MAG: fumarylacetoacetate hydrolase family protein [Rhodospirillales bacterium]|jgi:acylpyruvate hydrolase|nr:fumarylacetoacetate hydrolase family protein [Rhodospirillales bacterium]
MRLVTFKSAGRERVGALLAPATGRQERVVDLNAAAKAMRRRTGAASRIEAIDDMVGLLEAGSGGMAAARRALRFVERAIRDTGGKVPQALQSAVFDRARVRLSAPIPRPPKFVCVGLNYRDHAIEAGLDIPDVPVLFSKFPGAVIGPADRIVMPRVSEKVDYEGEFTIVIGRRGRHVPKSRALDYVAGYTIVNDVSARDYQRRTSQWLVGKTFDAFGVMGPAIVTADEIPKPRGLGIRTWVNGELRQSSDTSQLIFSVQDLIWDISRIWTLEPGDVIATGTPSGVGAYFSPPRFLKPGDKVRIEVEKIGVLQNTTVAEKKPARRASAAASARRSR